MGGSNSHQLGDYQQCASKANKAELKYTKAKRHARGEMARQLRSRSILIDNSLLPTELRFKYRRHCMYQRGYHREAEFSQLPVALQNAAINDSAILRLVDTEPMVSYFTEYKHEGSHKAFAISPLGAWGWASRASSPEQAASRALANCQQASGEGEPPICEVINIDTVWKKGVLPPE